VSPKSLSASCLFCAFVRLAVYPPLSLVSLFTFTAMNVFFSPFTTRFHYRLYTVDLVFRWLVTSSRFLIFFLLGLFVSQRIAFFPSSRSPSVCVACTFCILPWIPPQAVPPVLSASLLSSSVLCQCCCGLAEGIPLLDGISLSGRTLPSEIPLAFFVLSAHSSGCPPKTPFPPFPLTGVRKPFPWPAALDVFLCLFPPPFSVRGTYFYHFSSPL